MEYYNNCIGSFIITSIIYSVFTTVYRMIFHNFYVIDRIFSIETLLWTRKYFCISVNMFTLIYSRIISHNQISLF